MKISTRMLSATTVSFVIIGAFLIGLAYKNMSEEKELMLKKLEQSAYDAKRSELETVVNVFKGVMGQVYKQKKAEGASEEQTKKAIKNAMKFFFFKDNSGYIFAYNHSGVNVFHARSPKYEGKNLINFKTPDGVYTTREFIKAAKAGGGIVEYTWPKKGSDIPSQKFTYATNFDPYDWVIVTGMQVDDVRDTIKALNNEIQEQISKKIAVYIFIALALIIASIIIINLLILFGITKPLNELIQRTEELSSGEGDLTKKLTVKGNDEIAQASKGINAFIEKVRILILDAKCLSNENSSVAHELSTTSMSVGASVNESTQIVDETTSQATQMKDGILISIDEAKSSKDDIDKANEVLSDASNAILSLTDNIKETAMSEIELASKIQQLSQDTEQVKDVLLVIGDIAEQTNLLALNAAIEAARAGEHGRGFAVVADEVRKLAERTQRSLTEINTTISVIIQSIVDSSDQMSSNSKNVEELSHTAMEVETKITQLSTVMAQSTKMAEKTVNNYLDAGKDLTQMTQGVSKINDISKDNTRSIEEIASAAEHLNKMTDSLNNKLSEFRT